MRDEVDELVEAWARERGDLDLAPVAVFSRISRLARHLDLARRLLRETLVTSGTMTNRVDRLAARGYVERYPDPEDRRGVIVRLTAEGKTAVDAAFEALLEAEKALLADLPAKEQKKLAALLRSLLAPFA
jgi:DNA-binding MarR family transcriptional regulator